MKLLVMVCLLFACGPDEQREPPSPAVESPSVETQATEPGADPAPSAAEPLNPREPEYEQGECRLILGPDRRFPPRAAVGDDRPGLSHLPAISADGERILITLFESVMAEGTFEEEPDDVEVVQASDGSVVERLVISTPEETEAYDVEAIDARARAVQSAIDSLGYQSFRRMRGPVRAPLLDDVLTRLDELEGPCRQEWGIPAGATFAFRLLGGIPFEDDRCRNEVHEVDLHVDLEHRVGLIRVRVGTPTDLCESGRPAYIFRWTSPD